MEGPKETCCLSENGRRCGRAATSGSLGKKVEKLSWAKKASLRVEASAGHWLVCGPHAALAAGASTKGRPGRRAEAKEEEEADSPEPPTVPPLHALPAPSLRRIKKHFKIHTRQGLNKAQLCDSVWAQLQAAFPVSEKEVLTHFIFTVKTNKNRLHVKLPTND